MCVLGSSCLRTLPCPNLLLQSSFKFVISSVSSLWLPLVPSRFELASLTRQFASCNKPLRSRVFCTLAFRRVCLQQRSLLGYSHSCLAGPACQVPPAQSCLDNVSRASRQYPCLFTGHISTSHKCQVIVTSRPPLGNEPMWCRHHMKFMDKAAKLAMLPGWGAKWVDLWEGEPCV